MQGILVFASVMETLGLQIILESMRTLFSDVSCYDLIFGASKYLGFCYNIQLLVFLSFFLKHMNNVPFQSVSLTRRMSST